MNEIILFFVILFAVLIPLVDMMNKKTMAKKEKAKINAKIESEKKLKAEKVKEFDKNLVRLEKLGKLYKDGIITKEEFEEKKKEFKI